MRKHSETWQQNISVTSKFMILLLWPQKDYALNIEECRNSLRKSISLCEDYISKSSIYFLQNGLEQLKTIYQKKFNKNVNELVVDYYREKKENIKKKIRKLISGQIQFIRYTMKSALYSLVTSNDYSKSIKRIQMAYN